MRLLPLLGALTLLTPSISADSSLPPLPSTTEILYWPLGSAEPSTLARVAYDPTSLKSNLLAYHPPSASSASSTRKSLDHTDSQYQGLVRLGLYTTTPTSPKQWTGSLVSLPALAEAEYPPTLRLHLGPLGEVYHVSLAAADSSTASPAGAGTGASPRVELVVSEPATQPHLNRPIVVGPDGANAQEVPEKTFLQKYWWVLLILMFMTMSGGGGGGEGQ